MIKPAVDQMKENKKQVELAKVWGFGFISQDESHCNQLCATILMIVRLNCYITTLVSNVLSMYHRAHLYIVGYAEQSCLAFCHSSILAMFD